MGRTRSEEFAIFIIEHECTIRECAKNFDISKSTVHNDLSKKLKNINKFLYAQVYRILKKNLNERSYRGGMATKLKYLRLKKNL